jgi:hypothetical protein
VHGQSPGTEGSNQHGWAASTPILNRGVEFARDSPLERDGFRTISARARLMSMTMPSRETSYEWLPRWQPPRA